MDTRGRLVEATRDLLWERGYTGTSPKLIQDRSGVGQGSMYHHFSGKAALARAAIEETALEHLAITDLDAQTPGTPYEKIERWLRRDRPIQRGCRIGRLVQEPEVVGNEELREPLAAVLRSLRDRLAVLIREGVAAGSIRDVAPAEVVAATLVSVMQGGYVTARAAGNDEPFRAGADGVLALLRP
jgi:AcrR family transcriptional regulator